ncbi:MAG TPA: sensor histidine kinase [Actinomycetes bacterium]|nr:sensor histidine kinase [Actinomycetes bacterium]
MKRRLGLQAKMTASYLLVTAAAVILVEAVVAVIVVPGLVSQAEQPTLVPLTASGYANRAMLLAARSGRLPTDRELQLGDRELRLGPGQAQVSADGTGVAIPYTTIPQDDTKPMSLALLLTPDGRVVASSYPARYRVGGRVGEPGMGALPARMTTKPPLAWGKLDGLVPTPTPSGDVLWAAAPVVDLGKQPDLQRKPLATSDLLGVVYVQVPAAARLPGLAGESTRWDAVLPQLGVGLLVLVAAIPVGLVFGLLSTRRLVGRLQRLAATTVAVAGGDFQQRVAVSGGDEVAQLEGNLNRMAERLDAAIATERQLAEAGERARIARELHDSISQDLFSLRLLAGGLRRALPAGSPLHPQVETMEHTATQTMHEMQALLLELRPVALADAGLVAALQELCGAYHQRLGVTVDAELEPVELVPPAEHAVLRVVQEALVNAVKHAQPTRITLRLHHQDGQVAVAVTDDGAGFDPARATERHGLGLGLMRERVAELGGTFQLDSTPGQGTSVRVVLPRGRP